MWLNLWMFYNFFFHLSAEQSCKITNNVQRLPKMVNKLWFWCWWRSFWCHLGAWWWWSSYNPWVLCVACVWERWMSMSGAQAQFMQSGGTGTVAHHQFGGTCQFCNIHSDTRDHFGLDLRLHEERWKKWRFHLKLFRNPVLFATVLWGHFGRMGTSLSIAWQWTLRFLLLCGTK